MSLLDTVLFRGRFNLRTLTLRVDRYGIYLLAWQEEYLVAGISFQYPEFITKNIHLVPGLSIFSWDAQERIEFWKERDRKLDGGWYD